MSVNIICMKWGSLYGPEYVLALQAAVARHLTLPHRFVCFTDDSTGLAPGVECLPLPELSLPPGNRDTRWRKLAVLGSSLADLKGTTLFLDIDLVVVDSLDPFFSLPGAFRIIRDDELFRPKLLRRLNHHRDRFLSMVGNSSVFRFEVGAHHDVLTSYLDNSATAGARYGNEQEFLSAHLAAQGELAYWPMGWCVSFKNACVPRLARSYFEDPAVPAGARIVVFAGNLKMGDVVSGGGQRWYRRIGKTDWLEQAWTCPATAGPLQDTMGVGQAGTGLKVGLSGPRPS